MTTAKIISNPSPNHWVFSDHGQRPVEGTALYRYFNGYWFCEEHGYWSPKVMTIIPCWHIREILKKEEK